MSDDDLGIRLVGDDVLAPCVDGIDRPVPVARRGGVHRRAARRSRHGSPTFLPRYSSVHRGAGWKSQLATVAYEEARGPPPRPSPAGSDRDDVAIICRNTTEAINHLAYRLGLERRRRRGDDRRRAPRQPAAVVAGSPVAATSTAAPTARSTPTT